MNNVQQAQIEYLKRVICTLDSKLEYHQQTERQLAVMKNQQQVSEQSREDLKKALYDTTSNLKTENGKLRAIIEEALVEKRKIEDQRASVVNENQSLLSKIANLEIKNQQAEHKLAEMKVAVQTNTIYQEELRKAKNEISSLQKSSYSEINTILDQIQQMKQNTDTLLSEKKNMAKEIRDLTNTTMQLKSSLAEEKLNNRDLRQELDCVSFELQNHKNDMHLQSLLASHKNQNIKILEATTENNQNCLNQMQQLEAHLMSSSKQNAQLMSTHQQEIANLQKILKDKETEVSRLHTANISLKNQAVQLQEHIVSLENNLSIKKDTSEQIKSNNDMIQNLENNLKQKNQKINDLELLISNDAKKTLQFNQVFSSLSDLVVQKDQVSLHYYIF